MIQIGKNAAKKAFFAAEDGVFELIARYSENGRDVVNMVQLAGSIAMLENRNVIKRVDVEWVIEFGRYTPKYEKKVSKGSSVGRVNGLAVYGSHGAVMDIEATALPYANGKLTVTGIIEEEEFNNRGQKLKKGSSARASIENILTVLRRFCNIDYKKYNIHINFPCSCPVDGPSAGIAIICAVYSAVTGLPIDNELAMTGEISIYGDVKPVGDVASKVAAAQKAGVKKVLIPKENYQELFKNSNIEVIGVNSIKEVFSIVFDVHLEENSLTSSISENELMTAKGV